MNLSEIVSSGDSTSVKKKSPMKVPWQFGGGGDTDDWKPARCRPTSVEKAKHRYEGIMRARDESKKIETAKRAFRDRLRWKPVITHPSEEDLLKRFESPFAVMEPDLLESYYCRPPKVYPSLIELLDKYYELIDREFHPSYLDLPTVRTEPIVHHTETARSILDSRRNVKERRVLKVKQDEISNLIRTRIKGLKRLRDGYVNTEKTYKCHFTERKKAKIKEKKEYIRKLAEEYNCSVDLLESRTDSLYEKYIQSKKEKIRTERKYVEGTLEWMERLLQEERKMELQEKPPKPFVYRKKIKPVVVEEFITLPPPTLIPIPEEEEEEEVKEAEADERGSQSSNRRQSRKASRRASRRSSRRASRRSSRRASRKSSRRASRKSSRRRSRKGSKKGEKKSEGRPSKRKDTKKYSKKSIKTPSVLKPYVEPEPVSVLDPELVGMFRQWEEKRLEVEKLKLKGSNLPPKDPAYATKPSLILINNFLPNVVYRKKVKLINRNNQRAYCRPYMIKMEPDDDQGVLQVEPWRVLSSLPGIYPVINVVFSPVETTGRIEADIIFLSRHPPKSWKSFSFHVTCIPPTPQISVEPVILNFPSMKIWSQEVLTNHFTVTNTGAVACTLFVRKKDAIHQSNDCEEIEMMYEDDYEDTNQIKFDSVFCIYPSIKFMGLNDKNKAKPKAKPKNRVKMEQSSIEDESVQVVSGIVEKLFNSVFETFTYDRKYEIEIPGRSRLLVSLAFKPRFAPNVGTVHEEWCLTFTDFGNFCHIQMVNIFAQIETTPLYVKPLVLDMKLCLLENGVQQDSFIVGNKGRRGHQLTVKIPHAMSNQAVIHNPGPLVLGGEEVKILVRVDLKYSFCAESNEFYDPDTNILDFPVYVSSKDENETGPPLIVRVMAIVSRSMGLQVMPALINYGVVYTYQSAVAAFYLANHTLATHKFAFLNLPKTYRHNGNSDTLTSLVKLIQIASQMTTKWVMIQPGYGFGEIGAGEKLKFELIYSPTEEQVAWPGGSSEHFFILIATTMDRLANHHPVHKLITIDHRHEQQFPKGYEVKEDDYPPIEEVVEQPVQELPVQAALKRKNASSVVSRKGNGPKKSMAGSKGSARKTKPAKTKVKAVDTEITTNSKERVSEDPLDFNFIMPDFDELLELYKRKSIFGDELLPYGAEGNSNKKNKNKQSITAPAGDKVNTLIDGRISPKQDNAVIELQNEVEILSICKTPDPVFTYLAVRAVVIDPHCELSAQRIVLPPTPYYSYTITPFFLRCPNLQTYKTCYCGKDINKSQREPPKVRARYEFFTNLPFLDVEPSSGQICTGQNVKISIIVRPKLSQDEILEQAKILKAIAERERLLRERRKRKERRGGSGKSSRRSSRRASRRGSRRGSRRASRKSSGKKKSIAGPKRKGMKRKRVAKRQSSSSGKRKSAVGKRQSAAGKRKSAVGKKTGGDKKRKNMGGKDGSSRSRGSSGHEEIEIVVNPQDMMVDEVDLFNAKLNLMRYKEPEKFSTKVVCYIETELENPPYTKRKEELELNIYGTLVRPDIAVFTPPNLDQHIKFETTAVGLKRQLFFQVYNTSGRTVLLNHSFFDAPETYHVPLRLPLDQHKPNNYLKTGMWLEPDHHVNFPITFAPKKEKTISEFIEMRGNKTVVPLKIQGRGVEPKFKITPEFIVGKMRSNQGRPAKISFAIENQCDAELEFNFFKLYTKEGPIYPLDPPKPGRASTPKTKESIRRGRKSLSSRKSVSRKSIARKSVARKSVSRKSVSRKSVSRKSVAKGKEKSGKKGSEADMVVDKAEIKDEGRKNLAAAGGKVKSQISYPAKNYDEVLKGDLIHKLKNDFVPVSEEKQEYLYTVPATTLIKPHTSHRYEVVFRPFKVKNPEDEVRSRGSEQRSKGSKKSQHSRKSIKSKSSRKSTARKSKIARKSKVARKSISRKSVARKSVARKSTEGGRKSTTRSRRSRTSRGGIGSKKSLGRKIEYIIEEEMFSKTYVSKIRLMLGSATKVLDWWFLGQVFEKTGDLLSRSSRPTRGKK